MNFKDYPQMSPGSHPSSSPRFICRLARQWRAVAGEGRSRHVESCPDCQEYFRALNELDHALRRDALPRIQEVAAGSDNLERDILRAVRQSTPPAVTERPGWRIAWLGTGMAAAAAMVAAVTLITRETRTDLVMTRADADQIVGAVGSLSDRLVDSVIPSAGEMVAKNPMQQEIGSVYSDMRSALDFLAMNFLPKNSEPRPARSSG